MLKFPVHRKMLLILFILLVPLSCNKDKLDFPYVHINIYAGIYTDLGNLGVGDFKFYFPNQGLNGLVIYRYDIYDYYVFDRTCPYESNFNCAVDTTSNSLIVQCPCCGSQWAFIIDETSLIKGPARYPLVRYNARLEGDLLHITN